MKTAVYPGTFDPITNGHLDLVKQASEIFDRVIVTIAINRHKKPLFSIEERLEMIAESIKPYSNVECQSFEGLIVDFVHKNDACALIKGLRAVSDFEYELQMALINKKLGKGLVTAFFPPDEKFIYLSSTIVKEVAFYGGDISDLVPPVVADKLREKFKKG